MRRLLFLPLLSTPSEAAEVVFTPSTSIGVTNYTIYYGAFKANIGTATNWVITNVSPSAVVSIHATAWANGQESLASNSQLYTNKNFAPTNLRIIGDPIVLEASTDLETWRTLAVIHSGDPPILIHPDIFSFYRTRSTTQPPTP